jgi:hypothetical protein
MPATLTIRDEALSGEPLHEWVLEVLTERLTIRELFRSRVYQEVQDYNRRRGEQFVGLVPPDEPTEATLNRPKAPKAHRPIDWKRQYDRALEAFEKKQVLVLMDDRQAESLDEEVVVGPKTTVTFLRLMPLVGG